MAQFCFVGVSEFIMKRSWSQMMTVDPPRAPLPTYHSNAESPWSLQNMQRIEAEEKEKEKQKEKDNEKNQ